jgi:metal-responsive CopG/Arc/MetJ family transcriptional regulator
MTTTVPVRMKENTIRQIDQLQTKVHAPSRSDAIRRAIEISDVIVNAIKEGDKIIIEGKNGKKRQILITGLTSEK